MAVARYVATPTAGLSGVEPSLELLAPAATPQADGAPAPAPRATKATGAARARDAAQGVQRSQEEAAGQAGSHVTLSRHRSQARSVLVAGGFLWWRTRRQPLSAAQDRRPSPTAAHRRVGAEPASQVVASAVSPAAERAQPSHRRRRPRFDWNRGERFAESLREAAGYGPDDTWLAELATGFAADSEDTEPGEARASGWPLPPGWGDDPPV